MSLRVNWDEEEKDLSTEEYSDYRSIMSEELEEQVKRLDAPKEQIEMQKNQMNQKELNLR